MNKITINTNVGKIIGYQEDNINIFRGIPYALTKRFKSPTKYIFDEFDATKEELNCYQYNAFYDESKREKTFYYEEFRKGCDFKFNEELMTLNIITPENASNCSVLVFIHGGSFLSGGPGEIPFGICKEYASKDIIFVSIGYRLNIFGTYNGENFNLQDQIFALNWIKDNIKYFGGNEENINIIGQSAGAMSIQNLLYSDKLKGIVKGAIMMSGGGHIPFGLGPCKKEKSYKFFEKVMHDAGCDNQSELEKVDPKTLFDAYEKNRVHGGFRFMQPCVDNDIILDKPKKLLKQKKILDIPLMLGVTSQDMIPPILYKMALNSAKYNSLNNRSDVYCYFFDRTPPGNRYKAFHSVDLWYLFGNMDKSWRPFEEIDYKLSKLMIEYISNFVKYHNPNNKQLFNWPKTSHKQKNMKLFDGVNDTLIKPKDALKKTRKSMFSDKGPL